MCIPALLCAVLLGNRLINLMASLTTQKENKDTSNFCRKVHVPVLQMVLNQVSKHLKFGQK